MSAVDIYALGGVRTCTQCGATKPNSRENFGSQSGGTSVKKRCRECERANSKKNHAANPELMRARAAKARIARGNRQPLEYGPIAAKLAHQQGGQCYYCGTVMDKPTLEHKQPINKGGADNISNMAAACLRCNQNKRDKTEAEYRAFLKRVGRF